MFPNANESTRPLDHVVLAVPSLDEARVLFEALGFMVAPDARHPFGTENACVFFADGSFVEPLAIGHRETCEAAMLAGNVFVARDQAHRFRRGVPSFSGVALASRDAVRDAADLRDLGFGGEETLGFERRFETPDGQEKTVGFRLAFARDRRAPDVSFFLCEPTHTEKPDRSSLTGHSNGALGIRRVVLGEPNPTDFQYYLQALTGDREFEADSFGMRLDAGHAIVEVASPEALKLRYGATRGEERGLSLEGIVIAVSHLEGVRAVLARSGHHHDERGARLVLPLGPSAFIAFEEIAS